MVSSGEVESEYDSETDRSVLLRRRREATDDDEEVDEDEINIRRVNDDDDQSDGCEGAPEYYDDDVDEEASSVDVLENLEEQVTEHVTATKQRGKDKVTDGDKVVFAVPRIGAFYMHDDRCDGRRRIRYGPCRKKLWESKDELKWTHDKFEEMALEETYTIKELDVFAVPCNNGGFKAKESRQRSKSGNDGDSSRAVKGRGPVRYKPLWNTSVNPQKKSKQLEMTQGTNSKTNSARVFSANNNLHYERSLGKKADADSGRVLSVKGKQSKEIGMASYTDPASVSFHGLNADCDLLPFDQHLLGPSMSSYPQPFHPANSFHHDNHVTQRGMVLSETRNAVFPVAVLPNQIIHVPQANEFLQRNIAPLHIGSNLTSSPRYTGILGDQNYNVSPILFPVMQYGGLGDPAIDMTSTYYSNPDLSRYATRTPKPDDEDSGRHLPSSEKTD